MSSFKGELQGNVRISAQMNVENPVYRPNQQVHQKDGLGYLTGFVVPSSQVPGGRKSRKNGSSNSIQRELGSKSVLGGSRERFWRLLGPTLGPKIDPEEGPKTTSNLNAFQEAQTADDFPGGRLRPARPGPLGRGRGGVCNIRRGLY